MLHPHDSDSQASPASDAPRPVGTKKSKRSAWYIAAAVLVIILVAYSMS